MGLIDATMEKNRLLGKGILTPAEEARLVELKEIIKSRRSRWMAKCDAKKAEKRLTDR